jgi:hypothetical protein
LRETTLREVRLMASAVLLIGSIIGGVLVLAGQFFARRAEDRRQWLMRLQEAASDLATSYLQEAATVNDRRRSGVAKEKVETTTYVVDRQKALGRFRTLPWSAEFEAERQAMGQSITGLWESWDAPEGEFESAYNDARRTVAAFMTAVGNYIRRRIRGGEPVADAVDQL